MKIELEEFIRAITDSTVNDEQLTRLFERLVDLDQEEADLVATMLEENRTGFLERHIPFGV